LEGVVAFSSVGSAAGVSAERSDGWVGAVSSGPAVCARDARAHDAFARLAGSRGDVTVGGWHRGTGPGRMRRAVDRGFPSPAARLFF